MAKNKQTPTVSSLLKSLQKKFFDRQVTSALAITPNNQRIFSLLLLKDEEQLKHFFGDCVV